MTTSSSAVAADHGSLDHLSDYLGDTSAATAPSSPSAPRAPSPALPPAFEDDGPRVTEPRTASATMATGTLRLDSSRATKPVVMPLPDPSHFPDPYPFRRQPALSSAGSSSARSSAYTSTSSPFVSGDYGHVHVASGDDDSGVGVRITPDAVEHLLTGDSKLVLQAQNHHSRVPIDPARWSESYSSVRSRSSSISTNVSPPGAESISPKLRQTSSYDMGWQAVDEREEIGLSEDETDDDPLGDVDDEDVETEEERTSAVVIAEEGRGLIVQGDNVPIAHIQVLPGTTHLLLGSSSTPNAMPTYLTATLPQICNTLLALDISANFLGALPPILAICQSLEELNIAFNPLRVLPVFLADLVNLRVLIADSTGIGTLPDTLVDLDKLHTISIRKNKLHALPSWLCILPALQTLYVDGNPFQGPWKALVEPLLSKVPTSPVHASSTPSHPAQFPTIRDPPSSDVETDNTDIEEQSDFAPPGSHTDGLQFQEDEDHTITPDRAPILGRSVTSPLPLDASVPQPRGLTRTRTTPNRAHFDQSKSIFPSAARSHEERLPKKQEGVDHTANHELRKMKSAGDLRRGKSAAPISGGSRMSSPPKPLGRHPASVSSSNLVNLGSQQSKPPPFASRFATLGPNSLSTSGPSPTANGVRSQLTRSLWDGPSESSEDGASSFPSRGSSLHYNHRASAPKPTPPVPQPDVQDGKNFVRANPNKEGKDKGGRWGFLKKMSMGKMKLDSSPPLPTSRPANRSNSSAASPSPPTSLSPPSRSPDRVGKLPQIDVRFSTTGIFESLNPSLSAPTSTLQVDKQIEKKLSQDASNLPSPSSSNFLGTLAPPRSARRRSFLPLDVPLSVNATSESAPYASSLVPVNDRDETEVPSINAPDLPVDTGKHLRREEERTREAYTRALRSVMAYLKDMNDLGLSQQSSPMSIYGAATDDVLTTRSRRPTIVDGGLSLTPGGSPVSNDSSSQLRSTESLTGLRSGGSTQTLSIATTDSNGSSDERKFKDDKGKRAMIVREIVATERTYVKGLQELVDIYIKPASVPVNILSGPGRETVVPSSERKIVFGGIDALFSFHKDSFLPALESAAEPLTKSSNDLQKDDGDGQLSLSVVKAVAGIFLKHAAFMKMYSSYINNFDNSVQRVKYWSLDRSVASTSPGYSAVSPSSSTAHLVGLGLNMSSIGGPSHTVENGPVTGIPSLTTSQRKRIRSYLKRSRLHPRHSQLNLEGYLLLPVQRIPRYRLLLEELGRCTPPTYEYLDDPLDRAVTEISSLAINMNEGKRESESRRKLVQWQTRIRGKFPSPLVQPHRRLIMDGPLLLTRVVRKAMVSFEAINAQGDASTVQVDCLAPELTPRTLVGILCNDLLVLCRDPSEGKDPNSSVDLWAVLRMQTLPQPASIVHGNALRLVDNKAILYFDAPSPSDALNWYRAINLHIPASKS